MKTLTDDNISRAAVEAAFHRWNFREDGYFCRGTHDKYTECEWEPPSALEGAIKSAISSLPPSPVEGEGLREAKDGAYEERNHLVAALARLFPSGTMRTNIPGWDEEWHGCCYIDLPSGQISYHYHDSQAHLFAKLPAYRGEWDGHDKDEVHRRLAALSPQSPTGEEEA